MQWSRLVGTIHEQMSSLPRDVTEEMPLEGSIALRNGSMKRDALKFQSSSDRFFLRKGANIQDITWWFFQMVRGVA